MRHCFIGATLSLAGALALAGCNAEPAAPGDRVEPPAPSADLQVTKKLDLSGQWGVSNLDGRDLSYRVPFTGTRDALFWEPGCAGQDTLYRITAGQIEFYREPQDEPRIVCDIGYPDDLPVVLDALQGQWKPAQTPRGDIVLSRGAKRLTLEKLPVDKIETLAGEWRVAGIDGEGLDEPLGIPLSATDDEIWYDPRCAGASLNYRIVNERFVWLKPPEPAPLPPGAVPPPPPPVCAVAIPSRLSDAMNAIRAADRVERTRSNGVRLSGNGRSITLFSQ